MFASIHEWDIRVVDAVQRFQRPIWLDNFMATFTYFAHAGLIWLALGIILVLFVKCRRAGITLLLSQVIVIIGNELILKNIFRRPRPTDLNPYIQLLVERRANMGYSMPSGHASLSFAAALVIAYYNWRLGIIAYVFAALIAFSRVYLYMHFVTDVAVALFTGSAFAFGTIKLVNWIYTKKGNQPT
ncbi:MAG: phosphatase PAP2 family protein [Defluviitaleaceae bacterium]|nr:phosphatase PAP2 family protein [Defluviitaleaceae bacterium]